MSTDDPVRAGASPPPHCSLGGGNGQQSVYLPGTGLLRPSGLRKVDALEFLRLVHGDLRGYLVTLTGKHAMKEGRPQLVSPRQRSWSYPARAAEAADYLLGESERGRESYFGVSLFDRPDTRQKEYALGKIRTLWCDTDGAGVPEGMPQPGVGVESSPGRHHLYWPLSRAIAAEVATDLTRRIAYFMQADIGKWGITTVLRPPGTINHKLDRYRNEVVGWLVVEGEHHDPDDLDRLLPSAADLGLAEVGSDGRSRSTRRTSVGANSSKTPVAVARQNGTDLPEPVARLNLSGRVLQAVRGERPILTRSGAVDRSRTLGRIGGVLHARGVRGEELAAVLEERDAALGYHKYTHPYRPDQYAAIATKLAEVAAGRGRSSHGFAGKSKEDERRQACMDLVRRAVGEPWRAKQGPTDFAVFVTLVAGALERGALVDGELRVRLANRPLALAAGLARHQTAMHAVERLKAAGRITVVGVHPERGTEYAIAVPTCAHQGSSHNDGECDPFGARMWRLICRFRRPDPAPEAGELGRLGKLHALVLAKVILAGRVSLEELEAETERRKDSLRSRYVADLLAAGLVVESEGSYCAPPDVAERLEQEHEVTGVLAEEKRQRNRYEFARRAWARAYTEWRYGPPPDEGDEAEVAYLVCQGEAERRHHSRRSAG